MRTVVVLCVLAHWIAGLPMVGIVLLVSFGVWLVRNREALR